MSDEKHPRVATDDWLYRRGYATPEKKFMNPDGTATSRVFKLREKDNGKLSVDVKRMTTPERAIIDPTKFMLFEIANQDVESLSLSTLHDPMTLERDGIEDEAHAVIVGMDEHDEILPGLLARKSRRVLMP